MLELNAKNKALENMTDEELVDIASLNSAAVSVLISRYENLIWFIASDMTGSSADTADLAQEGMIGLLNAVFKFNPEKNTKFYTFARVCVNNRMKTVLNRNHDIAVPFESLKDGEEYVLSDNPESIFIRKEYMKELYNEVISQLSSREWSIFRLFLKGLSYSQIADSLGVKEKSVDNAMQRIRRKLKASWNAS